MIRQTDVPPLGNSHVRAYLEDPDEAPPELRVLVDEWVEKQGKLQLEAQQLVDDLEALYPTPTPSEIIGGGAVFPPWHGKAAWDILKNWPWAENLDEAIEEGKAWLEREISTEA